MVHRVLRKLVLRTKKTDQTTFPLTPAHHNMNVTPIASESDLTEFPSPIRSARYIESGRWRAFGLDVVKYLLNRSGASTYPRPMNDLLTLTAVQLRHAAELKEKIVGLDNQLASLLGSSSPVAPKRGLGRPRKEVLFGVDEVPKMKRRKMSAAGRASIAAAAKARWAKAKAAGKTSL